MLLQLLEPGQTPVPHDEDEILAVGIDLGTTHSLVGVSKNQKAEIFTDDRGDALIPSVVSSNLRGELCVGQGVGQGNHDEVSKNPTNTVSSVKRFMGGGADKGSSLPCFKLGERSYTPVEISAEILKAAKTRAETSLSQKVTKAVITVPAYFDDTARTATRDAARLAGLEILRLMNEPTAAALAYGLDKGAEGVYAVYDLGGGTFDVSVLRFTKGVFQVLATGGDTCLGGDDFDQGLLEVCLQERQKNFPDETLTAFEKDSLKRQVRPGKEALTTRESVDFTLSIEGRSSPHTVTRKAFEVMGKPLIDKTLSHLEDVLTQAGVDPQDLKGLILVGGATRMPCVPQALTDQMPTIPLLRDLDPDLVVAQGAALQAEALTKGSDTLLLDVTPLSLGLETMGDLTEKIIPRNSPIPLSKAQEFTTYQDGQTALSLHVIQGERELASDCRSLAHFTLQGIPPMVAGAARIEVTFTIDADGLLTVGAREKTTGISQRIEVKPTYGLSEEEVADLIRKSYEAGSQDMKDRLLNEAKVDAKRLVLSVQSALMEDSALLTADEKEKIQGAMVTLEQCCEGQNREDLLGASKILEATTEVFAARRMNAHLKASLQGRQLSDIETIETYDLKP